MPVAINQEGQGFLLDDGGHWQPSQVARNPQTKQMYIYDGKSWVEAQMPTRSIGRMADDAVRSVASGATFGFADEMAAGADAMLGRGTYQQNIAREQERNAQIPASTRIPGEIAGGVGAAIAGSPFAAATGLARVPAWVRNPAGGTISGALYGAGDAAPGQRMEGAGKGAVIGGVTGVGVPMVAGLANEVRRAASPRFGAVNDLARAIQRDETTPDALMTAARQLDQVRPGGVTLGDVGGENVRGLVERIAQTPGAGRTTVVPFLTDRQRGQMARISGDLRSLTGTQRAATQAVNETMEQRAQNARPLYDDAFNFNAAENPEIVRAWQNATATGWGRAITMKPQFRRALQTEYGTADPSAVPLMQQIDTWKKIADDLVGDATRAGRGNEARTIANMRDSVLQAVDGKNDAYRAARDAWAGPSRYLDAIEDGRNILSRNMSADELTASLARMTDAEREAYRIGAVSSIQSRMGADPANLADMTKYLRAPETRAKIAALMPTPQAQQAWQQRLDFEVSSSRLTGQSLGNSATPRRLAERQDADGLVGDLIADAFAGTPPVGLMRRILGGAQRATRDTLRSRSDRELAGILTEPMTMQDLQRTMQQVGRRNPQSILRTPAIRGTNAALIGE